MPTYLTVLRATVPPNYFEYLTKFWLNCRGVPSWETKLDITGDLFLHERATVSCTGQQFKQSGQGYVLDPRIMQVRVVWADRQHTPVSVPGSLLLCAVQRPGKNDKTNPHMLSAGCEKLRGERCQPSEILNSEPAAAPTAACSAEGAQNRTGQDGERTRDCVWL